MNEAMILQIKDIVLHALRIYEITVTKEEGKYIYTEGDFCIEIENQNLFKLSQEGYVIAPYDDLDEMCRMIKMG